MVWGRILKLTVSIFVASLCIFFGGILCLFVVKYITSYTTHEYRLREYKYEFSKIRHPLDTSSVAFESRVDRPPGNGTNCFYFVGELRRYWGTRTSIYAFYTDNNEVELEFVENGKLSARVPYGLSELSNWSISSANSQDNLYLVYSLNSDFDEFASFDLRCH